MPATIRWSSKQSVIQARHCSSSKGKRFGFRCAAGSFCSFWLWRPAAVCTGWNQCFMSSSCRLPNSHSSVESMSCTVTKDAPFKTMERTSRALHNVCSLHWLQKVLCVLYHGCLALFQGRYKYSQAQNPRQLSYVLAHLSARKPTESQHIEQVIRKELEPQEEQSTGKSRTKNSSSEGGRRETPEHHRHEREYIRKTMKDCVGELRKKYKHNCFGCTV